MEMSEGAARVLAGLLGAPPHPGRFDAIPCRDAPLCFSSPVRRRAA